MGNLEEVLEDCIPPMSFEPSEHPTSPPSERDGDMVIETPPQVVDLMEEIGLSTIASLIRQVRLDGTLSIDGADWAILAPTDDAFASLGENLLTCISDPKGSALLRKILLYHVSGGRGAQVSTELGMGQEIVTLSGGEFKVVMMMGEASIQGPMNVADVVETNIASNGVVFTVDEVLVPAEILEMGETCGDGVQEIASCQNVDKNVYDCASVKMKKKKRGANVDL